MNALVPNCGSPFIEVACYLGRWFLRDGYHRAYRLLRHNITTIPAIVIQAHSIAQLGAVKPWFFDEPTIFSDTPPLVTDFLNDRLTLQYTRPSLIKTIRVTIETSMEPEAKEEYL